MIDSSRNKILINNGITKQHIYFEDCINGMKERIPDNSVDLIVSSPPYWDIKDYGFKRQIGFGQSLEEYLKSMNSVFFECFRVLKEARRMIINIRDIPIASAKNGPAKERGNFSLFPLHIYLVLEALKVNFHLVGIIIWCKTGKCNSQEGAPASFLGSYPYPPSAHITSKIEYILIFRKKQKVNSRPKKRPKEIKERSMITRKEWLTYTNQIWEFPGIHIEGHPAAFPEELPKRCIKLWSFVNDIILDPFLGTGSTLIAAQKLDRNGIGFELNSDFLDILRNRFNLNKSLLSFI